MPRRDQAARRHTIAHELAGNIHGPVHDLSSTVCRPSPRIAPACDTAGTPGTVFSPDLMMLVLEHETGPDEHLHVGRVLEVVQRLREAILSMSNDLPDRVRSILSGHDNAGGPLDGPHLAFLPLAPAGHRQSDGRLSGVGLALPECISPGDRRLALAAVRRVRRLLLGRLGTWRVVPVTAAHPGPSARLETWTAHPKGATHWATVTPVVYDRHPKTNDRATHQREVASMIAKACTRIGLPEPREVIATAVSTHLGIPPANSFPRLRRKDGSERQHMHAILVFDRLVRGPILIGAGRYRGYGVCRAVAETQSDTK